MYTPVLVETLKNYSRHHQHVCAPFPILLPLNSAPRLQHPVLISPHHILAHKTPFTGLQYVHISQCGKILNLKIGLFCGSLFMCVELSFDMCVATFLRTRLNLPACTIFI